MPGPILKLEEQFIDLRSDQMAYKLTVENQSAAPIRLLSVEPQIPDGVQLVEVSNTSLAEANARKKSLLDELNRLLNMKLWSDSNALREAWIERQQEALRKVFSITGIFRFYAELLWSKEKLVSKLRQDGDALAFTMTTLKDAERARERWINGWPDSDVTKGIFTEKVEQLARIYESMSEEDQSGLTTIEPSASYTATYVLRFKRRLLEPAKYQFAVSAAHSAMDSSAPATTAVAINAQISPAPWSLSVVAIIASLLGVLLKVALADSVDVGAELMSMFWSMKLLVAPILALIFFNVYEYTSLGKDISIPVSWRSALLIGAICGITQDKVLAALKAFIGS